MKYIAMTIIMVLLVGCQSASNESQDEESGAVYRKISPEEAKKMMEEEGVLIVDVREQNEYDEGHIKNATLIPVGTIQAGSLAMLPDKDQKLLIYCRSGNRSGTAAKALVSYGYTQVYDFGGVNTWPYELVQ